MGLVNRVLPPDEVLPAAVSWAQEVADNCSPSAVAVTKAQLNRSLSQDITATLLDANAYAVAAFRNPDVAEGVKSFVEKRQPHFPPLGPRTDAQVHIIGPEIP
jgi:enoyl-CoA hydratase/carnithine racemase